MKIFLSVLLFLSAISVTFAADDSARKPAKDTVFREPFTLKHHIDKEHFYEQKFDKIPFVNDGDVYLFKGDEFGLTLDIHDNSIRTVKYQSDVKKADVTLKFTQEVQPDGSAMMMLHIHNNTKQTLHMDALMTVPDKKGIAKTSILPVQPGLSGFESWPHPIVQLVLRNIRIAK
jgi:predicted acyl esterase